MEKAWWGERQKGLCALRRTWGKKEKNKDPKLRVETILPQEAITGEIVGDLKNNRRSPPFTGSETIAPKTEVPPFPTRLHAQSPPLLDKAHNKVEGEM